MPLTWDTGTDCSTYSTWTTWVSTASTSATTDTVWATWNGNWTSGASYSNVWVAWAGTTNVAPALTYASPETEEHRLARVEAQRKRDAERLEAQERAEQLLRDQLTIEQAAQLVQGNHFDVISESGKRYRIQRGYSKNVALLEGERITKRFCIHPDYDVPAPDVMLAQKLMLETMEAQFLRIANAHPAEASYA